MKLARPITIREDFDELVFQTMDEAVGYIRRLADQLSLATSEQQASQVRLGHALLACHETLEHGEKLAFYERHGIHPRRAQRCMKLAREIGDGVGNISPSKLAAWKDARAREQAETKAASAQAAQAEHVTEHLHTPDTRVAFDEPSEAWNEGLPNGYQPIPRVPAQAARVHNEVEHLTEDEMVADLKAVEQQQRVRQKEFCDAFERDVARMVGEAAGGRVEIGTPARPEGRVEIGTAGPQLTLDWSSTVDRHRDLIERLEDEHLGGVLDAERSRAAARIIADCDARLDELLNADPGDKTTKWTTNSGSPSQTGGQARNPFPPGRAGGFLHDDDARDKSVQPSISLSSNLPGAHQRSAGV